MHPLSIEIIGLLAGIGLGIVHIVLASHSASFQRGYRWTAGPRDAPLAPLQGLAGRFARANSNYLETFPFFAAAVLAVQVTHSHFAWSTWGVILYLMGRLAYLLLYAFGTFLVRSLVWSAATVGIGLVCLALIMGSGSGAV